MMEVQTGSTPFVGYLWNPCAILADKIRNFTDSAIERVEQHLSSEEWAEEIFVFPILKNRIGLLPFTL
jgi:hypothetical protein